MDTRNQPAAEGVTPLSRLPGYKVAEGDPDVRGWEVVAGDGRAIGEVRDLLVDTGAMKVRYLDVELARDLLPAARGSGELRQAAEPGLGDRGLGSPEALGAPAIGEHLSGEERLADAGAAAGLRGLEAGAGDDGRHVLIPIGYAQLADGGDRVLLDRLRSTEVAGLPAYDQSAFDRVWEAELRQRLDGGWKPAAAEGGPAFYAHEHYDDTRFYGSRRHATQAGQLEEAAPPVRDR